MVGAGRIVRPRAVAFGLLGLVLLLGLSTCGGSRVRAMTPPPRVGNFMTVGEKDYFIVTCEGVNQAGVKCPKHMRRWQYKDALVCRPPVGEREATPPPDVCRELPHGCIPPLEVPSDDERVPPPRCRPDDPLCGPQHAMADCLERGGYDWNESKRLVVTDGLAPDGSIRTFDPATLENQPQGCVHDGDCHTGEQIDCNLSCSSRLEQQPPFKDSLALCRGIVRRHDHTFCGCVEGRCRLFVQPSSSTESGAAQ